MNNTRVSRILRAFVLVTAAVAVTPGAHAQMLLAQLPELADPSLPDIAMVTTHPAYGTVIVYNPILCDQAGPDLCEFYRWHEYGHINLDHTLRVLWPQEREAEADCWAAKNAPVHVVEAGYQWFASGGGGSPQHGAPWDRAQRLAQCAGW